MLTRVWAYLLILICGFNAIGVTGSAYLSEQAQESSLQSHSNVAQEPVLVAVHSEADGHKDCESHSATHQCHLGHCTFIVASVNSLSFPHPVEGAHYFEVASLLSVELSGPIKPPRA